MENKFSFPLDLLNSLKENGIKEFTNIQRKSFPIIKKNQNTLIIAPTGVGKTLCFLLPIITNIKTNYSYMQAIILTPTNILAKQIQLQITNVTKKYKNEIKAIVIDKATTTKTFIKDDGSSAHIIISTPDNFINNFIKKKTKLNLNFLKYFVIDEIDYMVNDEFIITIDKIYSIISKKKIQTIIVSATMANHIKTFIKKYLPNIQTIQSQQLPQECKNNIFYFQDATGKDKIKLLKDVIDFYNPFLCIVFANTKKEVDNIYDFLKKAKYNVTKIHGEINPRNRNRIIKEANLGKYQLIVASDLIARGVDIKNVSLIINYNLPDINSLNFFIHRCGRTNRMGSELKGIIYSFYDKKEQKKLHNLSKKGICIEKVKIKNLKTKQDKGI